MMDSAGIWAVIELPKELIWYIDILTYCYYRGCILPQIHEWCFIRISNNCVGWWGVHFLGKCTGGCTIVGLPLPIMPCHWVRRLVCGNCLGSPWLQAYLLCLYFVLVCCCLGKTSHEKNRFLSGIARKGVVPYIFTSISCYVILIGHF